MEFLVVGLNHRTAPLQVREQLAVTKAQLPEALTAMGSNVGQGVILSTCNRSEAYTMGSERHLEYSVKEFLAGYFDVALVDVEPYLYCHRQGKCIHHLFRVASGLDSMILGEGEILHQVRDAFASAVRANTVHGPMSHLFHQAMRVGKRIRSETGISRNASSVSKACVQLARKLLGDLRHLRVMVIGSGDAGELAARALQGAGAHKIVVTNRTYELAEELARELAGEAIPFQDMSDALGDIDVVISSTGSPSYVLNATEVQDAMNLRPERPLFLLDIAVPRDINPVAAEVGNVFLYDIDDLQAISEANRAEQEWDVRRAEELVSQEVEQFLEWYRALEAVPTISALRKMADEIRAKELAKLLKRSDHKQTSEEIESLEVMTRAIVNKLLHNPTTYLREHQNPENLRLARELFNLGD